MTGGRIGFWIAVGFAIWSSALIAAYAAHAIGCAFMWPVEALRVTLAAILAIHAVAVVGLLLFGRPDDDVLVATVARWLLIAALVAIMATFAPGLLLTVCV
jgi:hypothetical protein